MIGMGIDVGGTYTDIVVYDNVKKEVLYSKKIFTDKSNLSESLVDSIGRTPKEFFKKITLLSVASSLPSNACLEGRGKKAKLLFIGVSQSTLQDMEEENGSLDLREVSFLEGIPEKENRKGIEPDWKHFEETMEEEFKGCNCVGVVQIFPKDNNGAFEKKAKNLIEKKLSIPTIIGCEIFHEFNVIKRGIGALNNARLVPFMYIILDAVKRALELNEKKIPIVVVAGNGTLISLEQFYKNPMEGIMSGPAASVLGAVELTSLKNAVLIDMGGSTTDIALMKDGIPQIAEEGIKIGQYRTTLNSVLIDSIGIGGESAIRFRDGKLHVEKSRVMPISILYKKYPEILERLKNLVILGKANTKPFHEFFILSGLERADNFSDIEVEIYEILKKGPMSFEELAARIQCNIYDLEEKIARLEEEEYVLRSGLTLTDIMILKGDISNYDTVAASYAAQFLGYCINESYTKIPDVIYRIIEKKLFTNLVRVLLQNQQNKILGEKLDNDVKKIVRMAYRNESQKEYASDFLKINFQAQVPLIGVGFIAPIFLPRIAKLLGTSFLIPENSEISNAIGAISGSISAEVSLEILECSENLEIRKYKVAGQEILEEFVNYEEAKEYALSIGKEYVRNQIQIKGGNGEPQFYFDVVEKRIPMKDETIFLGSLINVKAISNYGID